MDNVHVLRLQLANLGVAPSWYKKRGRDGVKAYLSGSELRELVGRLKVAAATRTKMRWGDAPPESPSDYAAMFWIAPQQKGGSLKHRHCPCMFNLACGAPSRKPR